MRLAHLLRDNSDEVLASWESIVRTLSAARRLSQPALRDHMPDVILWLSSRLEQPSASFPHEQALEHAHERIDEGFDLSEVISEYAVLRDCLHELWEASPEGVTAREIRLLNQALDDLIAFTAVFYARTRLFGEPAEGVALPPAPH